MIHKYRKLIFDLDGTLIDSRAGIRAALEEACYRIDALHRQVPTNIIGPPVGEMINLLAPEFSDEEVLIAESQFRKLYDEEFWKSYTLYDGVLGLLDSLKALGATILLATNKPEIPTLKICKDSGMYPYFDTCYCLDTNIFSNKYEMLVNEDTLGAVFVGDTQSDAETASALGIDFIFCDYGFGDKVSNTRVTKIDQILGVIT